MSTVPGTPEPSLFEKNIVWSEALEPGVQVVVEEVVAARRELHRIRGDRKCAAKLLADVDGTLGQAQMRVLKAEEAWHRYVEARVEGPLP